MAACGVSLLTGPGLDARLHGAAPTGPVAGVWPRGRPRSGLSAWTPSCSWPRLLRSPTGVGADPRRTRGRWRWPTPRQRSRATCSSAVRTTWLRPCTLGLLSRWCWPATCSRGSTARGSQQKLDGETTSLAAAGLAEPSQRGAPNGGGLRRRPEQSEVATWVAEVERDGRRATGATAAARFAVSGRTGRRMLYETHDRVGSQQLANQPAGATRVGLAGARSTGPRPLAAGRHARSPEGWALLRPGGRSGAAAPLLARAGCREGAYQSERLEGRPETARQ